MPQKEFEGILKECRSLFEKKLQDYGPTWMFFRYESIADQLWIKIRRVRVLEENNDNTLVGEGRADEFVGIINYAIVALMRLKMPQLFPDTEAVMENVQMLNALRPEAVLSAYAQIADQAVALMLKKNHDYGDAWRSMSRAAVTDQIIIKIFGIKNIPKKGGKVKVSENIDAQFFDIINYCVFSLIKMRTQEGAGE